MTGPCVFPSTVIPDASPGVTVGVRMDHTREGYLRYAEEQIPNIALTHGNAWGEDGSLPGKDDYEFRDLANTAAQMWKQHTNSFRRAYARNAREGTARHAETFSAHEVDILLEELDCEKMHAWNSNERDVFDESDELGDADEM